MKVVLTTDIKGVGKRGELVTVSDGYYRNFLIPQNKAVSPDAPQAKKMAAEQAQKLQTQAAELEEIKKIAASYDGKTIELKAKAKGEKLFGAIHAADIAEKLGIDKKMLAMTPLKTIGEHNVRLQFSHGITATVLVVVTPS